VGDEEEDGHGVLETDNDRFVRERVVLLSGNQDDLVFELAGCWLLGELPDQPFAVAGEEDLGPGVGRLEPFVGQVALDGLRGHLERDLGVGHAFRAAGQAVANLDAVDLNGPADGVGGSGHPLVEGGTDGDDDGQEPE
jgi:hypothetical protein